MFESDDFDQILSQLDFPGVTENLLSNDINQGLHEKELNNDPNQKRLEAPTSTNITNTISQEKNFNNSDLRNFQNISNDNRPSSTHIKRKMLNSYFDHKSKRKFPGPAGLLTGSFQEKRDENICEMELLSQDTDFTQNYVHGDIFETPLWKRLMEDTKMFSEIHTIKAIKHQALTGNLQRKKAQIVTAFVESVDRSVIDPLITLRDNTGNIKCTLHRDCWMSFSPYIVAEISALVLYKPTVLTTGSAFKKHYLNITLSNIWAIYSSAIINEDESISEGFQKICQEDFTIIKRDINESDEHLYPGNGKIQEDCDLDDLDNVFLDNAF